MGANMWRFLAGVASTLLLVGAGFFIWRGIANDKPLITPAPFSATSGDAGAEQATGFAFADVAGAPRADQKSKEEKRFNRFDKDKNGAISQDEYLLSRQKAYAKLDTNGDGKISFNEYAAKTALKFAKADSNRSGTLTAAEFATTRVIRKSKPKPNCPPTLRAAPEQASEPQADESENG